MHFVRAYNLYTCIIIFWFFINELGGDSLDRVTVSLNSRPYDFERRHEYDGEWKTFMNYVKFSEWKI